MRGTAHRDTDADADADTNADAHADIYPNVYANTNAHADIHANVYVDTNGHTHLDAHATLLSRLSAAYREVKKRLAMCFLWRFCGGNENEYNHSR
jgi:hypothetical protein